jgi:hypothetical protein
MIDSKNISMDGTSNNDGKKRSLNDFVPNSPYIAK